MTDEFETVVIPALEAAAPGAVQRNTDLSRLSRWKIGGNARAFVEPRTEAEAAAVMAVMASRSEPFFIMGDASNVLFDSAGFSGVIMRIGHRMSRMAVKGTRVWAQAGIWVPLLARKVGALGLTGMEHTIGIPGTLGGLVLMNGGSQRKGIGLNISSVLCADAHGALFTLDREQCGFAYRRSALQDLRAVVLAAHLEFEHGDVSTIRRVMIEIMKDRRRKFPKSMPNCGSTFLSDPMLYATVGPPGKAIEQAGLKGVRHGGAQISPLHANFIVNTGRATSDDVLYLIALARHVVHAQTGYYLDCEVRHISPDGRVQPAHIPAEAQFSPDDFLAAVPA